VFIFEKFIIQIYSFSFLQAIKLMDYGPTCLRIIAKHYGKHYNADTLRQKAGFSKQGDALTAAMP